MTIEDLNNAPDGDYLVAQDTDGWKLYFHVYHAGLRFWYEIEDNNGERLPRYTSADPFNAIQVLNNTKEQRNNNTNN